MFLINPSCGNAQFKKSMEKHFLDVFNIRKGKNGKKQIKIIHRRGGVYWWILTVPYHHQPPL